MAAGERGLIRTTHVAAIVHIRVCGKTMTAGKARAAADIRRALAEKLPARPSSAGERSQGAQIDAAKGGSYKPRQLRAGMPKPAYRPISRAAAETAW
jgi:hypothetical protein